MSETSTNRSKVDRSRGIGTEGGDAVGGSWWRTGYVVTPWGVVGTYRQIDYTGLVVVRDGYRYDRSIRGRTLTDRGVKTLAGRFAREIAELAPTKAKSRRS